MNVLFVIQAYGGINSQIAQLALAAGLQKHINLILTGVFSDEAKKYLYTKNVSFIELYPQKKIDTEYSKELSKLFVKYNVNIVHFIDGKASRSGLIALQKFPKIKAVTYFGSVSLHWYDPTSYLTYLNPRIDTIIGNSNYVFNHVKKQLIGKKNKQKAIRIFKGYNPDWFKEVTAFDYTTIGIPKDAIVVTSIGNHRKIKGTKYFLASSYFLDTKKDIHYILIGGNTDTKHLKKIADNSPITKKIHVLGARGDVPSLLKGADMYVQTSLSEGFGRAISEAMCLGKPIIMTNAGGCTELIDKNSGVVVPLKDSKAIGKAISTLANDDKLRDQMGNNAKERITNVYHISRTIKETLELYTQLMNE